MNKISIITLSRHKIIQASSNFARTILSMMRWILRLRCAKSCPCLAIENGLGRDSWEQCVVINFNRDVLRWAEQLCTFQVHATYIITPRYFLVSVCYVISLMSARLRNFLLAAQSDCKLRCIYHASTFLRCCQRCTTRAEMPLLY